MAEGTASEIIKSGVLSPSSRQQKYAVPHTISYSYNEKKQ